MLPERRGFSSPLPSAPFGLCSSAPLRGVLRTVLETPLNTAPASPASMPRNHARPFEERTAHEPDHARASLYQRVTDQIIAELERRVMPWRKPWNAEL